MKDLEDLAALDDFLVEVTPVQSEDGDDDGVLHELNVGSQLVACEGADPVQEELGAGGKSLMNIIYSPSECCSQSPPSSSIWCALAMLALMML